METVSAMILLGQIILIVTTDLEAVTDLVPVPVTAALIILEVKVAALNTTTSEVGEKFKLRRKQQRLAERVFELSFYCRAFHIKYSCLA